MILKSKQIHPDTTAYTLGLLSADERRAVEQHAVHCPVCRGEMEADRRLNLLVRSTLQTTSHVDNGRLRKLMPALPNRRAARWPATLQRQLVPVSMLLLLFFSGLGVYQTMQHEPTSGVGFPTALAATATYTVSPTETTSMTRTVEEPTETVVASSPGQPVTPSPAATPIAYLHPEN